MIVGCYPPLRVFHYVVFKFCLDEFFIVTNRSSLGYVVVESDASVEKLTSRIQMTESHLSHPDKTGSVRKKQGATSD